MNTNPIRFSLCLIILFCCPLQTYAAGFLKYNGFPGESKSTSDRPTESISINFTKFEYTKLKAQHGHVLIAHDQHGKKKVLKKDGIYTTNKGEKIWVKNGKITRSTVKSSQKILRANKPSASTKKGKPKKNIQVKGKKILQN